MSAKTVKKPKPIPVNENLSAKPGDYLYFISWLHFQCCKNTGTLPDDVFDKYKDLAVNKQATANELCVLQTKLEDADRGMYFEPSKEMTQKLFNDFKERFAKAISAADPAFVNSDKTVTRYGKTNERVLLTSGWADVVILNNGWSIAILLRMSEEKAVKGNDAVPVKMETANVALRDYLFSEFTTIYEPGNSFMATPITAEIVKAREELAKKNAAYEAKQLQQSGAISVSVEE